MRLINNDPIIQLRKKISKSKYFKFFWKPLFSTFHDTLFVIDRKYFFGFSKSAATPRYTILDSRITLCNTSSEAGALESEVHIEIYDSKYMNRTKIVSKSKKISKSNFFQIFSGNHFSPRFMTPCLLLNENIFSVFRSPHLPLNTKFWTRGFPLQAGALLPAIRGTYRNMTLTKKNSKSKNF